jgi:hypothetical protein
MVFHHCTVVTLANLRATSHTSQELAHEIVRAQKKKSVQRPSQELQNHVGWSWTLERHFTLRPKVERPLISTNYIARNQEFSLWTLHTKVEVQRPTQFEMITFWRRQRTLEGSSGWTGMETQTMVERPSCSFHEKNQPFTRSWPLDWRGCFGQGIKWVAPLGWAWPLEASHYGRPSWEAVGVHGQRFGLWVWPLEASHYARPKAPLITLYWLFFSPFLWTLNKVWPLNPTASQLWRP